MAVWACGPPVMPPTSGHAPPETARAPATLDGEVLGVDGKSPETQLAQSVRLRLRTDEGADVDVLLAPAWVLDEKGLRFTPKERVKVTGTKRTEGGKEVFEAQSVKRGSDVLDLRDSAGKPLWDAR